MAKKLRVRYATAQDEKKIFDFYASHTHAFVAKRDPEIWRERIRAGAVTIIEDDSGQIVASSISYPLIVNGVHKWTEIGSTRVALEGAGLFPLLLAAQVIRAYLLEPPEDRFAIEIMNGNAHSKHVFLKEGGQPFDIPEELRQKVQSTMAKEQAVFYPEWFQLGAEAMPGMAQRFCGFVDAPRLTDKKTGEVYEIDFSGCVVATQFMTELRALAGQKIGDPKKPDLSRKLKP